jgi:hypothetical protein
MKSVSPPLVHGCRGERSTHSSQCIHPWPVHADQKPGKDESTSDDGLRGDVLMENQHAEVRDSSNKRGVGGDCSDDIAAPRLNSPQALRFDGFTGSVRRARARFPFGRGCLGGSGA